MLAKKALAGIVVVCSLIPVLEAQELPTVRLYGTCKHVKGGWACLAAGFENAMLAGNETSEFLIMREVPEGSQLKVDIPSHESNPVWKSKWFWIVAGSAIVIGTFIWYWHWKRSNGPAVTIEPEEVPMINMSMGRRISSGIHRVWTAIPLILLTLVPSILADSSIVSLTASAENCWRTANGSWCTVEQSTLITLLPAGQPVRILLRNPRDAIIGSLELRMKALTLNCVPMTEAWLRSYWINTTSHKACPKMGSCSGDFCEKVRMAGPNIHVDELKEVAHFPGVTSCRDSCEWWPCKCGLPTPSCIFYRYYALPKSETVYELISCPTWEEHIAAHISLEGLGNETLMTEEILIPGSTFRWQNISITPVAISQPPVPVLGKQFLFDGQNMALIKNVKVDMVCPDRRSAEEFNCSLSEDACPRCPGDHQKGTVKCSCRNFVLEEHMEDAEKRLPLNVGRLIVEQRNGEIFSETSYSPVQLMVKFEGVKLALEQDFTKCWGNASGLTGCYNCQAGASLSFGCQTEFGSARAEVKCLDGTYFTAKCEEGENLENISLVYNWAEVDTNCTVFCPGGQTFFGLKGHLRYIPLRLREYVLAGGNGSDEGIFWPDFGFDVRDIIKFFFGFPNLLMIGGILAVLALIGIIVLKFNPAFRLWRIAARTVMIWVLVVDATFAQAGGPLAREVVMSTDCSWTVTPTVQNISAMTFLDGHRNVGKELFMLRNAGTVEKRWLFVIPHHFAFVPFFARKFLLAMRSSSGMPRREQKEHGGGSSSRLVRFEPKRREVGVLDFLASASRTGKRELVKLLLKPEGEGWASQVFREMAREKVVLETNFLRKPQELVFGGFSECPAMVGKICKNGPTVEDFYWRENRVRLVYPGFRCVVDARRNALYPMELLHFKLQSSVKRRVMEKMWRLFPFKPQSSSREMVQSASRQMEECLEAFDKMDVSKEDEEEESGEEESDEDEEDESDSTLRIENQERAGDWPQSAIRCWEEGVKNKLKKDLGAAVRESAGLLSPAGRFTVEAKVEASISIGNGSWKRVSLFLAVMCWAFLIESGAGQPCIHHFSPLTPNMSSANEKPSTPKPEEKPATERAAEAALQTLLKLKDTKRSEAKPEEKRADLAKIESKIEEKVVYLLPVPTLWFSQMTSVLDSILSRMDELHPKKASPAELEQESLVEGSSSSTAKKRRLDVLGYTEDGTPVFRSDGGEGGEGQEEEDLIFSDHQLPKVMRMLGNMHGDLRDVAVKMPSSPAKSAIRMAMSSLAAAKEELRMLAHEPSPGGVSARQPTRGSRGGMRGRSK